MKSISMVATVPPCQSVPLAQNMILKENIDYNSCVDIYIEMNFWVIKILPEKTKYSRLKIRRIKTRENAWYL